MKNTAIDQINSVALPWYRKVMEGMWKIRRPLATGFLAAIVSAPLTLLMKNIYKSEAILLPANQRGGGSAMAAAAAAAGVNIPGSEGIDASFVDILKSRTMREALLFRRFRFSERTWALGKERFHDETLYDYLHQKNADRAIAKLKGKITVNRDLKSKVITVAVETPSPELSQQIVQSMVATLNEWLVTKSQTRGAIKAAFTEKRLEDARLEMGRAEAEFRNFLDVNRNYLTTSVPEIRLKGMRLENELKMHAQIATTLVIEREQALLEEKNDIPIINVLDPGYLPIEKDSPSRSQICLFVGLAFGLLFGYAENRGWIQPISQER